MYLVLALKPADPIISANNVCVKPKQALEVIYCIQTLRILLWNHCSSSAWCLTLGLTTFGQKFYELLNGKHLINREKKCFAECIFQVSGQVKKSVCSSLTFQIEGIVCGCPWGRHINSTICTCVRGKLEKLLSQRASACVCTLSMHQPFCGRVHLMARMTVAAYCAVYSRCPAKWDFFVVVTAHLRMQEMLLGLSELC